MKKISKICVVLMAAVLVLPSVFATGLGTSSKLVKVGAVDTTGVVYDVDVKWGNMIFDYVKADNSEEYIWKTDSVADRAVTVTNQSNVAVNAEFTFASSITGVVGMMDTEQSGMGCIVYSELETQPEDWSTGEYYEKQDESYSFVEKSQATLFEANKYYDVTGAGGGPFQNQLPGVVEDQNGISVCEASWVLELCGGSLSDIRPGATVGTLTITLS